MKTYIIYLAAGNSRRFKEDKLHALFKGKELYLYGIDTLKQLLKYRNDIEIIVFLIQLIHKKKVFIVIKAL